MLNLAANTALPSLFRLRSKVLGALRICFLALNLFAFSKMYAGSHDAGGADLHFGASNALHTFLQVAAVS